MDRGKCCTILIIQLDQYNRLEVCSPGLEHVGNTDGEVLGHVRLGEEGTSVLTRTVRLVVRVIREVDHCNMRVYKGEKGNKRLYVTTLMKQSLLLLKTRFLAYLQ